MTVKAFSPIPSDTESPWEPTLSYLADRLIHRLRNPLSVITTAASQLSSLSSGRFDDDEMAFLQAMLTASDRLEEIMVRFLQYACPEPPCWEKTDLNDLCRVELKAAASLRPNVAVEFKPESGLSSIACDPNQLRLVLSEILRNAFESVTETGRVTLLTAQDGPTALVKIQDDGAGMKVDKAEIFRPFVTTRSGHAGLGLATVARLVHAHGGAITAAPATRENGVEITIRLPFDHKQEEQASDAFDSHRRR